MNFIVKHITNSYIYIKWAIGQFLQSMIHRSKSDRTSLTTCDDVCRDFQNWPYWFMGNDMCLTSHRQIISSIRVTSLIFIISICEIKENNVQLPIKAFWFSHNLFSEFMIVWTLYTYILRNHDSVNFVYYILAMQTTTNETTVM